MRRHPEIGFVDATIVAMAEQLKIQTIATTDRRHNHHIDVRAVGQDEVHDTGQRIVVSAAPRIDRAAGVGNLAPRKCLVHDVPCVDRQLGEKTRRSHPLA